MTTYAEKEVLVLQGGGALGAYQAGAYEALCETGHIPSWVAGTSIGAVNAAIIAGNPPDQRAPRLREFWEGVSGRLLAWPLATDDNSRRIFNETSAALSAAGACPAFLSREFLLRWSCRRARRNDQRLRHEPLKATLLELVDFDLLNSGLVRTSIGAVQVLTGNMQYFDTASQLIGPEHVMASGALPPGFPPIEIDGEPYWDGGLFPTRPSNTCSNEVVRAKICASFRSTFSAPKAACRKPCSISRSGKRRSAIRVALGSIPMSSASCRPSAGRFVICGARCRKSFAIIPIGNSSTA